MRPLIFLTVRSTVNGVKRALTSAKRLISLIMVVGYYVLFFMRPFSSDRASSSIPLAGGPTMELPPLAVIDAIVFGLFALITLLLMLGVFGQKGSFRPADVDVLFPTPVNPKIVLIFRIARDYLLTLLLPLLLALIGYRPTARGLGALFRNLKDPEVLGYVFRAATVAWLLVAMSWVCIGYAASLFVNRSDLLSTRNRRVLTWGLIGLAGAISIYVALSVRQMTEWNQAVTLAHSPVLRTVFFTATAATAMVMGPLHGMPWMTLAGGLGLALTIAISLQIALTQVGWMYDQAAARGFDAVTMRQLQRKGDTYAILAEQAKRGKLKAGRQRWIHRIKAAGPAALIWKEAIIQIRSSWLVLVMFLPLVILLTAIPLFGFPGEDQRVAGGLLLAMQGFGVFMMSMSFAQTGFIEVLRRVDLQKPLPFTSSTTVLMEVVAKALPASFAILVPSVVAVVARPALWQEALASVLVMPSIAILICAAVFLVTILFPDVDDPTQRGFRGLMILLAILIAGSPGVIAFVTMYGIGLPALVAAIVTAALNVGITAGVATIAGSQYAAYNPSE
jgi:hypothetical protein